MRRPSFLCLSSVTSPSPHHLPSSFMITFLLIIYAIALLGVTTFGLLGFITLWFYWKHRHAEEAPPALPFGMDMPWVTVQLPIYNERYVVNQLIDSAVQINYPAERLQIQVVDDSSDETTQQAAERVSHYQAQGVNIQLLHRGNRQGYKAGALAEATAVAHGEFIAIFDADFMPPSDFLRHTIPYFVAQPRLGVVQTRWGHHNAESSPLTAAQAIAMDKHFMLDQQVRHRARFFPKFNGTAGIWRSVCIQDAGGWQADTVCEDLCLSTRAVLRGWDFQFLPQLVTPGELPTSMMAYKNQQARWAKGAVQCLQKFGWQIARDKHQRPLGRLYAILSMAGYFAHPCLLAILLLQLPLLWLNYPLPPELTLLSLAGLGQPILFILAQQLIYPDWRRRLRHFPTLMLITVGLAPAITRAIGQVWLQREHPFARTPKGQAEAADQPQQPRTLDGYRLPFDWIVLVEIGLAVYAAVTLAVAIWQGYWGALFLLSFASMGMAYVAFLSLRE